MSISNPIKYLDFFYRYNVNYPSSVNQINKWNESRNLINPLILEYFDRDNPDRKINETEPNNETTLRHFLKFLDDADAGVKLFEANQDFSNFQPLRLDSSGFVDRNLIPCNILNQN